jgi:hypothetical protein
MTLIILVLTKGHCCRFNWKRLNDEFLEKVAAFITRDDHMVLHHVHPTHII